MWGGNQRWRWGKKGVRNPRVTNWLYLVPDTFLPLTPFFPPPDDFVILSEYKGGLSTRPKPTAGIALDETVASQEAVRQVLRRFDKRTCHLTVVVRPDSYATFHHLRDRAIELGFEYRLMSVETDTPITDRGGSSGPVR